jgi:ligand-binding sensor domain-containing protein
MPLQLRIISLLFLFAWPFTSKGQDHFRFKTYGLKEGLSQSMVKTILQDSRGFLWFGTQDGLNRFDGNTFKNYYKGSLPDGMPWGHVTGMVEDTSQQVIWLATEDNGIFTFNLKQETFALYPGEGGKILPDNHINALAQSGDYIYVATRKGVSIIHKKTKELATVILPSQPVQSLVVLPVHGMLALANEGNAWMVQPHTFGITKAFSALSLFPHHTKVDLISAYLDQAGIVWAHTRHGLYYSPSSALLNNRPFTRQALITHAGRDLSGHVPYASFTDKNHNLWVGVDSIGLLYKTKDQDRFTLYQRDPANPYSIGDNYFWHMTQDKDGVVWIGNDNGATRVLPTPPFISTIGEEQDKPANRLYRIFSLYTADDELLYYGRRGNAYTYDLKSGVITPIENGTGFESGGCITCFLTRRENCYPVPVPVFCW